jgi:hypothetical protein
MGESPGNPSGLRETPPPFLRSVKINSRITSNDFSSLADLEQRPLAFQCHYERTASPFKWTFTRRDLHTLLAKIPDKRLAPAA